MACDMQTFLLKIESGRQTETVKLILKSRRQNIRLQIIKRIFTQVILYRTEFRGQRANSVDSGVLDSDQMAHNAPSHRDRLACVSWVFIKLS